MCRAPKNIKSHKSVHFLHFTTSDSLLDGTCMTLLHKTEKINHFDMQVMNALHSDRIYCVVCSKQVTSIADQTLHGGSWWLVQQHRPTAPSDAHHRQVHSTV